ncbi:hypothetical protein ZIOFF_032094 [Zingiber officinale]|uniref:Multifunctional fusion protein n=1 Tax=Zingiber officinale TaxID=94328 RepID=A0A8J5L632_ZINOF|nr:hypothetical protein ZIOFF_032094 [Zingiber officinale]
MKVAARARRLAAAGLVAAEAKMVAEANGRSAQRAGRRRRRRHLRPSRSPIGTTVAGSGREAKADGEVEVEVAALVCAADLVLPRHERAVRLRIESLADELPLDMRVPIVLDLVVHKQDVALGRSVDLTKFDGYDQLIEELDQLFEFNGELMAPNKNWMIVFTDNEDDMMLVGDDPWQEFCAMVRKIFIYTKEEVHKMDSSTLNPKNEDCPDMKENDLEAQTKFEIGHVLGVLLASSPLLEQAWTHCLRANACSANFIIDKSDDVVFIAFSRAQAAASPSGLGRGFFEPVSLYNSTHKLFTPLGRGEEDSDGKPQPVLLQVCMETIMHLTCTNMPVEKIDHALNTIKANGIQNVLALKGDPPHGQDKFVQVAGGFACTLDLVQHIRAKYGDYFGITVAGYPKAHPNMIQGDEGATLEAYNSDLAYLKRKTLSVVLKFWKSFSHVKILELCEIFILWSAIREA